MSVSFAYRRTASAGVEEAEFLITAGGDQERSTGIKRDTLDPVRMPRQRRPRALHPGIKIPELDQMVSRCAGEEVRCCGVPEDLSDFARGGKDSENGVEVAGFPGVGGPAFEEVGLGADVPDHDGAVFATGGDDGVVVRVPVRVEDGGGVGAA